MEVDLKVEGAGAGEGEGEGEVCGSIFEWREKKIFGGRCETTLQRVAGMRWGWMEKIRKIKIKKIKKKEDRQERF